MTSLNPCDLAAYPDPVDFSSALLVSALLYFTDQVLWEERRRKKEIKIMRN